MSPSGAGATAPWARVSSASNEATSHERDALRTPGSPRQAGQASAEPGTGCRDLGPRHPFARPRRTRLDARPLVRRAPCSASRSCTTRRRSSSCKRRSSWAACRWGKDSSEISMIHSGSSSSGSKLLPKAAPGHPSDAVFSRTPRADGNERMPQDAVPRVKKRIGFLSSGHWHPSSQSRTNSGRDALVQTIELAVAAEELGVDGAFFRVHHFARQLASPVPAARRDRRAHQPHRVGTGVIDMRYENPLYMAEEAASADLISAHAGGEGRLQLGVSRGSPETGAERRPGVRLRSARGRDRCRPRPRQDGAVPRRDRRRRGRRRPNPR